MIKLLDTAVEILRNKLWNGKAYYWLLYYSLLSLQQLKNVDEVIDKLCPYIRNISYRTYYQKCREVMEALGSVLWGYTAKEDIHIRAQFFPE